MKRVCRHLWAVLLVTAVSCSTTVNPSKPAITAVDGRPNNAAGIAAARIFLDEKGGPFCSGILVDGHWILTAAHCFAGKNMAQIKVAEWNKDALGPSRSILKVVYYEPALMDSEFPNFDIALVQIEDASSGGSVAAPVKIFPNKDDLSGAELFITGQYHKHKDCKNLACISRGSDLTVKVLEKISSSRLFSLLKLRRSPPSGEVCYGHTGGGVYVTRDGVTYLVGSSLGVVFEQLPHYKEQPDILCESGETIYTDLRDYRPWVEHVLQGTPAILPAGKPARPQPGASFEDWCRYGNYEDNAWRTVQKMIKALAFEPDIDTQKLYTDCAYVAGLVKNNAGEELSFPRPSQGGELDSLKSFAPLASLGEITALSIFFNDISALEVPDNLAISHLEIVSSTLDNQSFCTLLEKAKIASIGLWEVKTGDGLDLSCVLKSRSLQRMDLVNTKVLDHKLIDTIKKKIDLLYEP